MNSIFATPPFLKNHVNKTRSIGFELEFGGLNIKKTAEIIAEVFSSSIQPISEMELKVETPEFGAFTIELDWQLGKKIAKSRAAQPTAASGASDQDILMNWLQRLAGQVVPVEVICPPLPLDKLDRLNPMVEKLRLAGAQGTEESFLYAFGVHINPEITDDSAASIAKHVQAFSVAQEWLFSANNVDTARKITPYINIYPDEYLRRIFGYDTTITHRKLIGDYLEYNPTRNRALDMLPLWSYLDEEFVQSFDLGDTLTKKRPTFHYRLPNCEIEKPNWLLNKSWNIWCVVETIAADDTLLRNLIDQWHEKDKTPFFSGTHEWHSILEKIYRDLL